MSKAFVECFQQERPVTMLGTTQSEATKFVYYWNKFIEELVK